MNKDNFFGLDPPIPLIEITGIENSDNLAKFKFSGYFDFIKYKEVKILNFELFSAETLPNFLKHTISLPVMS